MRCSWCEDRAGELCGICDSEARGGFWALASVGHAVYFGVAAKAAYEFSTAVRRLLDRPTDHALKAVIVTGVSMSQAFMHEPIRDLTHLHS